MLSAKKVTKSIGIFILAFFIVLVVAGAISSPRTPEQAAQTLFSEENLSIPPETQYVRNVVINSGADVKVMVRASDKVAFRILLVDNRSSSVLKEITPLSFRKEFSSEGRFDFKTDTAGVYSFLIYNYLSKAITIYEFSVTAIGYITEQVPDVAKGRRPNQPLAVIDNKNDLVLCRGNMKPSGINLAPVDIVEMTVINDGKNLLIQIKTAGVIPKAYRDKSTDGYYFFEVILKADSVPNKLIELTITSQEMYWFFWPPDLDERDAILIKYSIDGDTVTFTIPLSLREFGGQIDECGVRIRSGYEAGRNTLCDYVPDQVRGDFKLVSYKLWA